MTGPATRRPNRGSARLLLAALSVAVLAGAFADTAAARRRDRYDNGWGNGYDRWENRRDARRAGVVAGVVASSVARGAAVSNANRNYEECQMASGYDYDCERRYYEDRRDARSAGRAVGVAAGAITYGIVRDN